MNAMSDSNVHATFCQLCEERVFEILKLNSDSGMSSPFLAKLLVICRLLCHNFKLKIMKTGIELIAEERQRQIEKENFSIKHDVKQYANNSQLELAAVAYAMPEELPTNWQRENINHRSNLFPWDKEWWKPSTNDRIKELQKAGALIAAKIDVLLSVKEGGI